MKINSFLLRCTLIAALGGFLFGFETAVISGAEKTIQQLWSLSDFLLGFTVAASLIGTVIGSMIAGKPAQQYGRKKVLLVIALMYLLSAIGCSITPTWTIFIIFRMIGGIAVGASSVVGPMYISEISPAEVRGRLTGMFQLNIVIGILVAFLTNFAFLHIGAGSWRWMVGIMAIPAGLFALLLRIIPESPRWLILNNRDEEAARIFERTGEPDARSVISEEHALLTGEKKLQHAPDENLFSSKFRKPILYAVLLAMFNQLSGINAILYYAPRIFEMAGFTKQASFLQPIYIGGANLIFTLLGMSIIDKVGRKTLLITGAIGTSVFLALTAFTFIGSGSGNQYVILYLISFIAFFALSQGAVIWVFISEIFPNSVRSQGSSLGSFTHWIMAVIVAWTFPIVLHRIHNGGFYSFIFFSFMMLVSLFFIWRVMPETKGRTLEQIQKDLGIV
ncbi:MAG TPA: sugar porter family MFS transporter [Puia sp.]|nr:sugar porter family MFS transporter [Puia sp.]